MRDICAVCGDSENSPRHEGVNPRALINGERFDHDFVSVDEVD